LADSFGLFRGRNTYGHAAGSEHADEQESSHRYPVVHVAGQDDWNSTEKYAEVAAAAHNSAYRHGAECYIAPQADRMLLTYDETLHDGARKVMRAWLKRILRPSPSI
jgi:hypothetical protein